MEEKITTLKIKPLSVNKVWQGRRFKTKTYKSYEKDVFCDLPNINIPEGKLELIITFGFSNSNSDVDNCVKPLMDILQKRYGFNDRRVYKLVSEKIIVRKGEEFISFSLLPYKLSQNVENKAPHINSQTVLDLN